MKGEILAQILERLSKERPLTGKDKLGDGMLEVEMHAWRKQGVFIRETTHEDGIGSGYRMYKDLRPPHNEWCLSPDTVPHYLRSLDAAMDLVMYAIKDTPMSVYMESNIVTEDQVVPEGDPTKKIRAYTSTIDHIPSPRMMEFLPPIMCCSLESMPAALLKALFHKVAATSLAKEKSTGLQRILNNLFDAWDSHDAIKH